MGSKFGFQGQNLSKFWFSKDKICQKFGYKVKIWVLKGQNVRFKVKILVLNQLFGFSGTKLVNISVLKSKIVQISVFQVNTLHFKIKKKAFTVQSKLIQYCMIQSKE